MKKTAVLAGLMLGALPAYAADKPMHIEVALGDVSINKIPFIIAADAGIYKKYDLDVHQVISPGAARAVEGNGIAVPKENIAVAGGPAPDIDIGGGAPLINGSLRANAQPHRIILATNEEIVRDHIIAIPAIKNEADLKGKTLGAGMGNVPGYAAQVYARKMGWNPKTDLTIINGDKPDQLQSGKAQAIMASGFTVAMAPEQGYVDVVDLAKYHMPEPGSGISAEPKWLAANHEAAMRFVKASIEATALMKKDKKVFAATTSKWFGISDPKVIDRLFAMAQDFPDKPYPAVDGIKMALAISESPEKAKHTPEEYYDSSFVTALDKDGFLDQVKK